MSEATIGVENVSLSFGDLEALADVSLSVESGEFVGFVGPNGAGKTTLLRVVSGALEPDSGRVTIDGVDVHEVSSSASSRLVSVVPQDTSLSFSFPVRDVVEMGRHPHRSRFAPPSEEDREAVERALERTRTLDLAERPIDEVSGGQRQRVVLARAVAQETPALLLDEPTASLDINHQIETLELVRELVADGRTVCAAIHDLNLAARYCDRLVMLGDGRVRHVGEPETVLTTEALAEVFDSTAAVTENPITGTSTVTALPGTAGRADDPTTGAIPDRVHVLGSGSGAVAVLSRLADTDADLSLGPVPAGDAAVETARRVGVDVLESPPFVALSDRERHWFDGVLEESESVVLADPPLGDGTESLLEAVAERDSPVVVESDSFAGLGDRRSDGGESALEPYERCRRRGICTSPESVFEALSRPTRSDTATSTRSG